MRIPPIGNNWEQMKFLYLLKREDKNHNTIAQITEVHTQTHSQKKAARNKTATSSETHLKSI